MQMKLLIAMVFALPIGHFAFGQNIGGTFTVDFTNPSLPIGDNEALGTTGPNNVYTIVGTIGECDAIQGLPFPVFSTGNKCPALTGERGSPDFSVLTHQGPPAFSNLTLNIAIPDAVKKGGQILSLPDAAQTLGFYPTVTINYVNLPGHIPTTCNVSGPVKSQTLSGGTLTIKIDTTVSGHHTSLTVKCDQDVIIINVGGLSSDLAEVIFQQLLFTVGSTAPDLSIGAITLSQPAGTVTPLDSNGNPIIATTTDPNKAIPAPKVSRTSMTAQVTVNLSGQPSGATTTDLKLMLNGNQIYQTTIDISQFQQGPNQVTLTFPPPTDPNLLGVLPLIAVVNSSQAVQESNYSNNISQPMNVDVMVLCDATTIRPVPFFPQGSFVTGRSGWECEPYGIPSLSHSHPTPENNLYNCPASNYAVMGFAGCPVASLAMLFNSYGIASTPLGGPTNPVTNPQIVPLLPGLTGAPLNPGTLNYALANYGSNLANPLSLFSIGFNAGNDVDWSGAESSGAGGL